MQRNLLALAFLAVCPILVAQQSLNNDSVVKLIKAGLSDDLIVSTVNASPGTYDTSADGVIALKKAGASDKVVEAIMAKGSGKNGPATPGASSTPSGANQTSSTQETPATSGATAKSSDQPKIFIKPDKDFSVALAAAFDKKHVPATIVTDENSADYTLQSAPVAAKQESAGSKFARCMFAYCAGIEGSSSVSVELVRVKDSSVAWAYQVRKGNGGPAGVQSLSEAVAKHLKNDFLDRKK
jgi:hypothetical protein